MAQEKIYKAVVVGEPTKVMEKSNGAKSVLINVQLLDGPGKGVIVAGTRTILNAKGEEKSIPSKGEEISVYHTTVPRRDDPSKPMHFFEISTGITSASQDELTAIFGDVIEETAQKL